MWHGNMNNQQFRQWCERQANPLLANREMPLLMGILNVTPDSFSDAGCYLHLDKALQHARAMIAAGADLLDIGGESTRPFADKVSIDEEKQRIIPLIERIRAESDICISVDTSKPGVMYAAVAAGAGVINDITALNGEESLQTALQLQVPVCLMHMQGIPRNMQERPEYPHGVVTEINEFFDRQIERCVTFGLPREHLILDPGFGFGKTVQHNLQIIKHFEQFKCHGLPVMLGASRKNTLGVVLDKPVSERLIGGITLTTIAALKGAAMIRTHDVDETRQALLMTRAVMRADTEQIIEDRFNDSM